MSCTVQGSTLKIVTHVLYYSKGSQKCTISMHFIRESTLSIVVNALHFSPSVWDKSSIHFVLSRNELWKMSSVYLLIIAPCHGKTQESLHLLENGRCLWLAISGDMMANYHGDQKYFIGVCQRKHGSNFQIRIHSAVSSGVIFKKCGLSMHVE